MWQIIQQEKFKARSIASQHRRVFSVVRHIARSLSNKGASMQAFVNQSHFRQTNTCNNPARTLRILKRTSRANQSIPLGRKDTLQLFIESAVEGSVAFYAYVIYLGKLRVNEGCGWIEGPTATAERAWLRAYNDAWEWTNSNLSFTLARQISAGGRYDQNNQPLV